MPKARSLKKGEAEPAKPERSKMTLYFTPATIDGIKHTAIERRMEYSSLVEEYVVDGLRRHAAAKGEKR